MPEQPLLYGSVGINNKVDPSSLQFDGKTGIGELYYGMNVDIELPFQICSRKGFTSRLSGNCHSFFYPGIGEYAYYISAGTLYALHSGGTIYPIRLLRSNAWGSYVALGDVVFFGNGVENFYIIKTSVYSWKRIINYPMPPDYPAGAVRDFVDPPQNLRPMCIHGGRIYGSVDNRLYASEVHWFGYFDLNEYVLVFDGSVVAAGEVADGLFISDELGTYFAAGDNLSEMKRIPLPKDYGPIIPGTVCKVDSSVIEEQMHGDGLIWVSSNQICFGGWGGRYRDLSSHKLVLPNAVRGAALVKDKQYYFVLFE